MFSFTPYFWKGKVPRKSKSTEIKEYANSIRPEYWEPEEHGSPREAECDLSFLHLNIFLQQGYAPIYEASDFKFGPGRREPGVAPNELYQPSIPSDSSVSRRPQSPGVSFTERRNASISMLNVVPEQESSKSMGDLPLEIIRMICNTLPQTSLVTLMRTCRDFYEIAVPYIYKKPEFVSTYRFAQFAHIVGHRKHLADLVLGLDLSDFGEEEFQFSEKNEMTPARAGWRDFALRTDEMYLRHQREDWTYEAKYRHCNGYASFDPQRSHPTPCRDTKDHWRKRDVPMGGLCHVLKACQNLQMVNFSRLDLELDFEIETAFTPTAWTGFLFASDYSEEVQKYWSRYFRNPFSQIQVINQLVTLKHLKVFIAPYCTTIGMNLVKCLVKNSESLEDVAFTGASYGPYGNSVAKIWTMKGTKDEISAVIEQIHRGGNY